MRYYCIIILLCCFSIELFGQHLYGTTGLIVAPTAEMQKDKTIMIGGSMIDHNIYRDAYWNAHDEYNPYTFNYYVNITIFPWLEVAYTCTLVKGIHGAAIGRPRHGASLPTKTVRFTFVYELERRLVEKLDSTDSAWSQRLR